MRTRGSNNKNNHIFDELLDESFWLPEGYAKNKHKFALTFPLKSTRSHLITLTLRERRKSANSHFEKVLE